MSGPDAIGPPFFFLAGALDSMGQHLIPLILQQLRRLFHQLEYCWFPQGSSSEGLSTVWCFLSEVGKDSEWLLLKGTLDHGGCRPVSPVEEIGRWTRSPSMLLPLARLATQQTRYTMSANCSHCCCSLCPVHLLFHHAMRCTSSVQKSTDGLGKTGFEGLAALDFFFSLTAYFEACWF